MSRLTREIARVGGTLRDSLYLWRIAPLIPLIAMLPEGLQHALEIRLGMFASHEAFAAHAEDAVRLQIGSVKAACLALAILLGARFWANRAAGQRSWSLAGIGWKQVCLGFLVQILVSMPSLLDLPFSPVARATLGMALALASLPGLVLIVGGLIGDRESGLLSIYRNGWTKALRILLHVGPLWLLLQTLHRTDHIAAMERPQWLVWGLMAWDAMVVGQMAALAATGLHHGYKADDENEGAGFTAA